MLLLIVYCWVHVRRDFFDLLTKYPQNIPLSLWAKEWIAKIGSLYHINNERIKHKPGEPAFIEQNEKLKTALDKMSDEMQKEYEHPAQIDVMNSMKEHWEGLILFVEYSDVPMDNNSLERTLLAYGFGEKKLLGQSFPLGRSSLGRNVFYNTDLPQA